MDPDIAMPTKHWLINYKQYEEHINTGHALLSGDSKEMFWHITQN